MKKTIELTKNEAGLLVYFLHQAEVLQSGHNNFCRIANKIVDDLQTKIAKPFLKEPSVKSKLHIVDNESFGLKFGREYIEETLEKLGYYD